MTTFVKKSENGLRSCHLAFMNSPATFQRKTDGIFNKILFASAHLDDVVIFSESLSDPADHLKENFGLISQYHLKLTFGKFELVKSLVEILGQIVRDYGVLVYYKVFIAIRNASARQDKTTLERVSGLSA